MSTELSQFDELKAKVSVFVAPTFALKVSDFASCQIAVKAAQEVKSYLKSVEEKRKELVKPLNDRVDTINDYARGITGPLKDAEIHIKQQIVKFEQVQEQIRQEEYRKAELIRLEQERKAREAADQAAAELREKQEKERAREQSAAALFADDDDDSEEPKETLEDRQAKEAAELQDKLDREAAQRAAEAKQREWDIKQQGTKGVTKKWKCEVTDITQIPREYLIVTLNESMVLAAARGGNTQIPGLRIYQEMGVAIGSKTRVPTAALEKERARG